MNSATSDREILPIPRIVWSSAARKAPRAAALVKRAATAAGELGCGDYAATALR
jgi:hypothetical protein